MKKKLIKNLLIVVIMAVLCVAVGVTASAETMDSLNYYDNGDGTLTVFYCNPNAEGVFIPAEIDGKEVAAIDNFAFFYSYKMKDIQVDIDNKYFSSVDGVLYNKDKTVLVRCPGGKESCEILSGVTEIGDFAFANCVNLTSVTIPDGVTTIGSNAFVYCLGLSEVILPDSIEVIKDLAFALCAKTTEIVIPENVTKIEEQAFFDNLFLQKYVIKGMNVALDEDSLTYSEISVEGLTNEEFADLFIEYLKTEDESIFSEIEKHYVYPPEGEYYCCIGTIYCHSGSTAEVYAIENGIDYVLTHFYEDEWTYDYDNMIRYRKCIHCDELETETLETSGDSDVEIIAPVAPDTDFTVDVVEDYVIIEETISNNITTDFEIIKAFDINLKNKDGVHVQPDGTVKVKLPNDWSKNGIYKVYRINDDGTLTDMNAYRQGSHLVFDTDHFSIYVIVDESEKTDVPITPDEPQEETKDNFFAKLIDLFKAFFALIKSWFEK